MAIVLNESVQLWGYTMELGTIMAIAGFGVFGLSMVKFVIDIYRIILLRQKARSNGAPSILEIRIDGQVYTIDPSKVDRESIGNIGDAINALRHERVAAE